jgi:hypothetical protein
VSPTEENKAIVHRFSVRSKSPPGLSLPSFVTTSKRSRTGSKVRSSSSFGFAGLRPVSYRGGDFSCRGCSGYTPGSFRGGLQFAVGKTPPRRSVHGS